MLLLALLTVIVVTVAGALIVFNRRPSPESIAADFKAMRVNRPFTCRELLNRLTVRLLRMANVIRTKKRLAKWYLGMFLATGKSFARAMPPRYLWETV